MARSKSWDEDEIAILKAHYEEHGPSWDGWDALLPLRTDTAIAVKAHKLGLKSRNSPSHGHDVAFDRSDDMVMRMMADGVTPSQIDKAMHWSAGTASRIAASVWARQGEMEDRRHERYAKSRSSR